MFWRFVSFLFALSQEYFLQHQSQLFYVFRGAPRWIGDIFATPWMEIALGDRPSYGPKSRLLTEVFFCTPKTLGVFIPKHVGAECVKTLQLLFLPIKLSSLEVRFWWFWNHSDQYTGRAFLRRADTWFHIYHLESRWCNSHLLVFHRPYPKPPSGIG